MKRKAIEYLATGLQKTADGLCKGRIASALPLAAYIIATPDYRSKTLAGIVGGEYVGDKVDGKLAGASKYFFGLINMPDQNQPKLDQLSDKILTHSLIGAVVIREALNKNYKYAGAIAGMDLIAIGRDFVVNRRRDKTEAFKAEYRAKLDNYQIAIDPADIPSTGALKLGKLKQLGYSMTVTESVAPESIIPDNCPITIEQMVVATMAVSTVMSVISGVSTVRDLNAQEAEFDAKYSSLIQEKQADPEYNYDLISQIGAS